MYEPAIEQELLDPLDRPTPRLRSELVMQPQRFADKDCWVIEDPVNSRFFRVGTDEYALLSQCDGTKSIRDVLRRAQQGSSGRDWADADALALCQWAQHAGLTSDVNSQLAAEPVGGPGQQRVRRGRLSPLSAQIPLFHPDPLFERCAKWSGWLFSFPAFVVWVAVVMWASVDLLSHAAHFGDASRNVIAPGLWWWLLVVWIVLKIFHEFGHGLACKRLGGEVREAGVVMILLAPLAYVDVSSTWRLHSKWDRILVSVAGMYVELFIAAVATIVWSHTEPGVLNSLCVKVMLTASVMTLVFNANPLMRFDGYYVFSDLAEIPNLYALGQQDVRSLVSRYLLGTREPASCGRTVRGTLIRAYGLAAMIWRNLVFWGLVLTAATLFEGAGLILSGLAVFFWLSIWLRRVARLWRRRNEVGAPNVWRAVIVGGGVTGAALMIAQLTPWPGAIRAAAVVKYAPQVIVRASCDGFVRRVLVDDGQQVLADQPLIVLHNEPLGQEVKLLELDIRRSELRRRIHLRRGENAQAQAELASIVGLRRKLRDKQSLLRQLTVRSPVAGQVIGRRLAELEGRYLTEGAHLLEIGKRHCKELKVAVSQRDIGTFRAQVGRRVTVTLSDATRLHTVLTRLEPQARLSAFDPSLCAPCGGPLVVRQRAADSDQDEVPSYDLLTPHFTAYVPAPPAESDRLRAGQRGYVALGRRESVMSHLLSIGQQWIDRRLKPGSN